MACEVHTATETHRGTNLIRWFAVLPAAILGGILGYLIARIAFSVMGLILGAKIQGLTLFGIFIEFMASGASALLAIHFACKIAPSKKRLVFSALVLLLAVYNLPAIASLFERFQSGVLVGLIGSLIGVFGATSVLDEND